ncbi:Endoplasmic reticulum chaperone BiP [Mortierella alpina]|nr:Endoplasmic reticulum chaperone BiP [Mortierella alpina]
MKRSNRNGRFLVLFGFIVVVILTSMALAAAQPEHVATTLAIEIGSTATRVSVLEGDNELIFGVQGDPKVILIGPGTRSMPGPSESDWTTEGYLLIKNGTDKASYVHPSNTFFNLDHPTALRSQYEHYQRPTIAGYQAFSLIDITGKYLQNLIASAESIIGHNITFAAIVLPDGQNIRARAKEVINDKFRGNYTYHDRVYVGEHNPPSHEWRVMAEATDVAVRLRRPHVRRESFRKTSAAIFPFDTVMEYSRGVLVYRLGGSTFEVSVHRVDGGSYDSMSSVYDRHLGGNDFNQRVIDHLLLAHKNKTGQDHSSDDQFLLRLTSEVETAKRVLSVQDSVQIDFKFPHAEGQGFSERLTRSQFEDLNMDLFTKTITAIDQVIKNSAVYTKDDIQDIVFAGGSSNIPFLQSTVRDYFGHHKKFHGWRHPELTVVLGAAKLGHWYQDENHLSGPECCLGEKRTTLGIETAGGVMFKFTDKDPGFRINKMYTFSTTKDNQDRVVIRVFGGYGRRTSQNKFLGGVELTGIAPAPKGVPQIRVRLSTYTCGISVNLNVMDVASGTINGTIFSTGSWVGQERTKYESLVGGELEPAGKLMLLPPRCE